MKKKKKTLTEYINISKSDIYVYALMTIIIFLITIYISYKLKIHSILLLNIILIFRIIEKIEVYFNLKKIKHYLNENNLIDKLGEIDFWNERYYFLTTNYLIIIQNNTVFAIKYMDIQKIYITTHTTYHGIKKYLHIITNNNEFKILINTTLLVVEDSKDITDYLLNKNSNIIVEKTDKII